MRELPLPPIAQQPEAHEVLRLWSAADLPQQCVLATTWDDPAAWGLLLVDIARHAARAYAADAAFTEEEALARIKAGFDVEWDTSTGAGVQVHG
jgi:hypothetical protein